MNTPLVSIENNIAMAANASLAEKFRPSRNQTDIGRLTCLCQSPSGVFCTPVSRRFEGACEIAMSLHVVRSCDDAVLKTLVKRNTESDERRSRGLMEERDDKEQTLRTSHAERSSDAMLDLGHNSAIGKRLKAYYDDVASEPVPDRFLSLLDALDAAESASNKKSGR